MIKWTGQPLIIPGVNITAGNFARPGWIVESRSYAQTEPTKFAVTQRPRRTGSRIVFLDSGKRRSRNSSKDFASTVLPAPRMHNVLPSRISCHAPSLCAAPKPGSRQPWSARTTLAGDPAWTAWAEFKYASSSNRPKPSPDLRTRIVSTNSCCPRQSPIYGQPVQGF
jgi:hypothetical protein